MGMLLGVPTVAVIYKLACESLEKKEAEKRIGVPSPKPEPPEPDKNKSQNKGRK